MDLDSAAEDEQETHKSPHEDVPDQQQQRPQQRRKRMRAAAPAAETPAALQGGEDGGATHSNSGVPDTGGFGFNDGVGLSSKDEAQVSFVPTPIAYILLDLVTASAWPARLERCTAAGGICSLRLRVSWAVS